jgi:serine protease Do
VYLALANHDPFYAYQRGQISGLLCQLWRAVPLVLLWIIFFSLMLIATASYSAEGNARLSVMKVVALRQSSVTFGSAVVVAPEKVITSCHVVRGASEIKLMFGERVWQGRLVAQDGERDLCVVTTPNLDVPTARFGTAQELVLGQSVFAIGYPNGERLTLSAGHVKGLHEAFGSRVIQTSAYFEPGASGGGLFDADSRLVGFLTFKATSGGDFHFVMPIEWILKLIDEETRSSSIGASGRAFWEKALPEQPFFLQVAALEAKKDWHGLLTLAKKSILNDTQCGEPWIAMSKAYHGLGRILEAQSALKRAKEIDPASGILVKVLQ